MRIMPSEKRSRTKISRQPVSLTKSLFNLFNKRKEFDQRFKNQCSRMVNKFTIADVKKCLKGSPIEAKLYKDLCKLELTRLQNEKVALDKELLHLDAQWRSKNAEAAVIVKVLWKEVSKINQKRRNTSNVNRSSGAVKRMVQKAQTVTDDVKAKRRSLLKRRGTITSKIRHIEAILKCCDKCCVK